MKREPMVFAVAGMVFGFVLGYMAANWDASPGEGRSASIAGPSPGSPAASSSGAARPAVAPSAAPTLDPNELRALEALAARDKANPQVRIELGNLYMDHQRYDEAARWYREALALNESQPDVLVDLGACLVNSGKAGEGLVEFEKALQQSPNHKKALFNKGIALVESGRPRDAVAVWEDLLKRFPDDPQIQGLRPQIERVRAGTRSAS
jgi:cytochrome c-type biogenesis protein CcmH/NrfG